MGEVYKATDTRLDRTVAIKVLPEHLAESPERKARFEREAKVISQLSHPHICTLYDVGEQDGVDFIVMECIEGETLAERLKRGALPLDRALEYGIQVADGLDKAHRAGIVHRDLKPGNVMLTRSGVKLVDFGLARLVAEQGARESSDAPTQQRDLTKEQAIIGTLQYMSPEQLEGRDTDSRTDIFAFGALLYEMVTGNKAFSGKSQASLIGALMTSEPRPTSELRPTTPRSLDRIVRRCLAKDPDYRWQSARDVVLELSTVGHEAETPTTAPRSKWWERLAWGALVLTVGLVAGLWGSTASVTDVEPTRVTIPLPPGEQLLGESRPGGMFPPFDISPDGRSIVYASERGGDSRLFLRRLDDYDVTPIPGTARAQAPRFSPDGQWLGFMADGELRKISVDGGTAITIADATEGPGIHGWAWSPDGSIVVGVKRITRIPYGGGEWQTVAEAAPDRYFGMLDVLPDGRSVLATIHGGERGNEPIALVSTESGEARTLLEGYVGARYVPTGHIVLRDTDTHSLSAVAFDPTSSEVRGAPVPVVGDIYDSPRSGYAHFAVSASGTLVFAPLGAGGNSLVWVDRSGRVSAPLDIPPGAYSHPKLSPDGRRVAVDNSANGYRDIWIYDLVRGTRTRLSSSGDLTYGLGTWTPDGERVTYFSIASRRYHLFLRVADAGTEAEAILDPSEINLGRFPISWSPDGSTLAFAETQPAGDRDILLLRDDEVTPFLSTSFHELSPEFSPDGRYIAYVSNESGRPEVYVRSFPSGDQKWPISTEGGTEPLWSRDGRELFYRNGYRMFAVAVETGDSFRPGRPKLLFEAPYFLDPAGHPAYDVSPDGQRFLMIRDNENERTQLNVVFNWLEELERLVPTEN